VWILPIATTVTILLLSVEFISPTARACTLRDPAQGFAGILRVDTAAGRETWFDGVGIGAMCEISNSVDVSGTLAMVEGQGGVMLYDLAWNRDRILLPSPHARAPRVDQGYLYFVNVEDDTLERISLASHLQETVVAGTSFFGDLEISDGIVSWLTYGEAGPQLSVFDVSNLRFMLDRGALPPALSNASWSTLRLVGTDASQAVLLSEGRELYAFDLSTGAARLLVQLQPVFVWDVAYDDGNVIYVADRNLYFLDLSQNATRVVREDFLGVNVALDNQLVAYIYYVTRPFWATVLPILVPILVVASAVLVGSAVLALRRRRRVS